MNEEGPERGMAQVTPEVTKLKGGMRRNSLEIQSRYLMPSTGSCHDICKYGKKDVINAEGKHPFGRRSLWQDIARDKERIHSETSSLGQRRKEMVMKAGPTSPLKFQLSDEPNETALIGSKVTGSREKLTNMKLEAPLPTMKGIVSAEQTYIPASSDKEVNQLKGLKLGGLKGQMTELNTAVHQRNLPEKLEIRKLNDTLPASGVDALGEPIIHERSIKSLVRKSNASVSPKVIKQKVLSSLKNSIPSATSKVQKGKACSSASKSIPSGKFGGFKQKASASIRRADLSVKYAISLKRKAPVVKRISVLSLSQSLIRQRKQESQITKTLSMSDTRKEEVLKSIPAYMSTRTPSNGVWSRKQRKYKDATVASLNKRQERHGTAKRTGADSKGKVLDVVEQKSGNVRLGPIQQESENYKSEYSDPNDSISEEDMTEGNLESSVGEDKRRHTRKTALHGVEVFSKPQKLRFRRGKVVDLQLENTGPRRLRFSKRRVLGENSNGSEAQKRIVTKELASSVLNDPDPETGKVMLRHQDTQEKKDTQGLFNHVIEETATKLVETRKSMVKALVGAFETVISLQEIKPAQSELAIH